MKVLHARESGCFAIAILVAAGCGATEEEPTLPAPALQAALPSEVTEADALRQMASAAQLGVYITSGLSLADATFFGRIAGWTAADHERWD